MSDLHPDVHRLLAERFSWEEEKLEGGGLRATAPLPDLGSLANYVEPARRADFFRFWVDEVLDEALLAQFQDESIYPDRTPPSLNFVKVALERHKGDLSSRAYLFCLNLLVIYALGWRPNRPTQPMRPLMAGEGARDEKWASEAREHLIEYVLGEKLKRVALEVYARHAKEGLHDIELQDVEQEAGRYVSRLIAGESIDEMARALVEGRADGSDEAARPFEIQLLRQLEEEYRQRKAAFQGGWQRGFEEHEQRRLARGLIIGRLLDAQDAVASGDRVRLKSFWPGNGANLITHLFGSAGRRGRLYQELRDWLRRQVKARPDVRLRTSSAPRSKRPDLDAETFRKIVSSRMLGRAATPLNLAIMEGCWVENLEGRKLRMYLLDRGFGNLPSQGAIRQRVRYLASQLRDRLRAST